MVRIAQIESGSIADELELEIGSRIVRVNGERVRDNIDLTFLLADDELELEVEAPEGETVIYEVAKDPGEAMGIVPAPDTIRSSSRGTSSWAARSPSTCPSTWERCRSR